MLYKILGLAVLVLKETNAGAAANNIDPRVMWFRWAVPLGSKTRLDTTTDEQYDAQKENAYGQSVKKCGVDVAPNSIRKCYYTDCFKNLHREFRTGSRRRAAGAQIHADVRDGPDSAGHRGCGNQRRRRMAGGVDPLAIQCRSEMCTTRPQVNQFRYWVKGAAAYAGLGHTATFRGFCPNGTYDRAGEYDKDPETVTKDSNIVKSEQSWQWYGTVQGSGPWKPSIPTAGPGANTPGNCIYGAPPANCHCKTVVCKVTTDYETSTGATAANWDQVGTRAPLNPQQSDECNFIVRIEDFWPSPTVSKKMMWWIFIIAGAIALSMTAYYRIVYGAELEEEGGSKEGSKEGSDGGH